MRLDPDKWAIGRQKMFQANYILAHVAVILWAAFAFSWPGVAVGLVFYVLFGKMGGDVGFHRHFSHSSFRTSSAGEWFMLICGSLAGFGSSISWIAQHGIHHTKVDTQLDPHSPHRHGFWRTYFFAYDYSFRMTDAKCIYLRAALRDPRQKFIHRNYFKIYYSFVALLALLSLALGSVVPLVGVWAIPVVCVFHAFGAANSFCHKYGYQTYTNPEAGCSTNLTWLNWLLLGNGMHNNHHGKPWAYSFAGEKWYEFDLWGVIIRRFLMKKEAP